MARKIELSFEEAVATLIRSSLPTLIAEGNDDFLVLRGVEERLSDVGFSIFPVGGKEVSLRIWREVRTIRTQCTAVIVDKDMWLFEGTPAEYQVSDLIETNGFSIENDLFEDWDWRNLMSADERTRFNSELATICEWFAARLERFLVGEPVSIADHPNQILSNPEKCEDDAHGIAIQFHRRLRGKTLLELASRQLNKSGRVPKHSRRSLLQISASVHGLNMRRVEQRLREIFEA